ncbi:MAG: right-handed parallel beta-helix repeat-containing protein [Actinomycetota bacterium]|nr:right-handed parallel beta-helix repeat-containing protein [Actinomycetota bacterium]
MSSKPNGSGGIQVFGDGVSRNTIGGTSPEATNLISGNSGNGVWLRASSNKVLGNVIGTQRDGSSALGNLDAGVQILPGRSNTIKGNVIAFSRFDPGVIVQSVRGDPSTGNRILNNSIFSNDGLGIDLVDPDLDGVTANDPQDSDKGPNGLQNFPELLSATTNNPDGTSVIKNRLRSQSSRTYKVQFISSDEKDASSFGEGEAFIGQTTVTTNSNGTAPFTFRLPRLLSPGVFVTGTATNKATGDTSEFSLAREVTVAP